MKVLFLDVDGVLNSHRSCKALGNFPHKPEDKEFDEVAVGLIRELCRECNVQIVLSSTWRLHGHWVNLGDCLNLPIFDRTPVHFSSIRDGIRGEEVKEWLSQHPGITKYAIVDDGNDFLLEQQPYFVQTDFTNGLLWQDYIKLKEILSDEEQ